MKDDLLERATRALSDRYGPENASRAGDLGLRRLTESMASARARRARLRIAALVAAASLVGFTAWAASSGVVPRWLRGQHIDAAASPEQGDVVGSPRAPQAAPPPPVVGSIPTEQGALGIEKEALEPAASSRSSAATEVGKVREATRRADGNLAGAGTRASVEAPIEPSAKPERSASDLDALYREAHEAHFVRRDPRAALAAWDRYIAAAGADGRMTLEARYNRAIALVRLGRNDEAKEALGPFARGEFGGYRRDDAARLLESLH